MAGFEPATPTSRTWCATSLKELAILRPALFGEIGPNVPDSINAFPEHSVINCAC